MEECVKSCRSTDRIARNASSRPITTRELVILLAHMSGCVGCTRRIAFTRRVVEEVGTTRIFAEVVDGSAVECGSRD